MPKKGKSKSELKMIDEWMNAVMNPSVVPKSCKSWTYGGLIGGLMLFGLGLFAYHRWIKGFIL